MREKRQEKRGKGEEEQEKITIKNDIQEEVKRDSRRMNNLYDKKGKDTGKEQKLDMRRREKGKEKKGKDI